MTLDQKVEKLEKLEEDLPLSQTGMLVSKVVGLASVLAGLYISLKYDPLVGTLVALGGSGIAGLGYTTCSDSPDPHY